MKLVWSDKFKDKICQKKYRNFRKTKLTTCTGIQGAASALGFIPHILAERDENLFKNC